MTGGSPYMNLHDFAVGVDQPGLQPPDTGSAPPRGPQVIEGSARPINKDEPAQKKPNNTAQQSDDDDDVRSMLE